MALIRTKTIKKGWVHFLVLPSHYIWLARECYHRRDFSNYLEYSRKALGLNSIMTQEAQIEANRFAGLSCARLSLENEFSLTMTALGAINHKRALGNRHFLSGFYSRLKGDLELAQIELTKAEEILKGSIDVKRELISVLLARRDFDKALTIAEELVKRAENNPYVLDGYLQAKIASSLSVESLDYDADFLRQLRNLQEFGDGPGLWFGACRKFDLAIKKQNKTEALSYAAQALKNTPNLPAAHAAYARANLAAGEYDKAWSALQRLEVLGSKKNNLRDGIDSMALYQVKFEYNLQKGRFPFCKSDVENIARLDKVLAKKMKMEMVAKL